MITVNTTMHDVESVKAVRYYPTNRNGVAMRVRQNDKDSTAESTMILFFGEGDEQTRRAFELFRALGGQDADIIE